MTNKAADGSNQIAVREDKQQEAAKNPRKQGEGKNTKKRFNNPLARNKSKKNPPAEKATDEVSQSLGDMEKRLTAKLEASLGLTAAAPATDSADNNRPKTQNRNKRKPNSPATGKQTGKSPDKNQTAPKPGQNKKNQKQVTEAPERKSEARRTNTKSQKPSIKNPLKKTEGVSIIPLGGLGEIGKNMTAIKYGNSIIVVDGGMSFPDDDLLGIDLVLPDYNYLLENKSQVEAVFVTHGHEDHIGGLPYLLKDLPVPVYGGKLTLGLLAGKLKEKHINNAKLNEIHGRDVIKVGPFKVEFIRVSHSIPDSFAIAIHTPEGVILHTGDFKLDMSPVDGEVMDLARLSALGEEGVLLLMADSTNVEVPGFTASEKMVGHNLESIFYEATGRIIVTSFASNVHRVQQAIWAAEHTNRRVAVVGRGMNNVIAIAQELGYLQVKRDTFIDISKVNSLPDNKVAIVTTGSQGETLAGLTRMSQDEHRQVHIRPGDLVVISANAIPGNEKTVARTVDNLYRHGADVIYGRHLGIHVSGHASAEDLKLMFNMIKPKFFMPVHGEYRMLCAHGKLAEKMGLDPKNVFILENGDVLDVNRRTAAISGKVHSGRVLIDGLGVGDIGTAVLKDRKQLSNDGIVIVNVVMDKALGRTMSDPYIVSRGFVYERDNDLIFSAAEQRVQKILDDFLGKAYNLPAVKSNIRNNLSKYFYDKTGRRPIVLPVIMEV